jgi:DNA-binding PucR family transcriptional regulator
VHRSAARASSAWVLHADGRLGEETLVHTDDEMLALLLMADDRLARDLVDRRLAPLTAMTPLARERAVSTLRAWFEAHGNVTVAAEALHVHPQTMRHRLGGLHDAFAGDLDDPTRRLEVALALRAAEQLGVSLDARES